MIYAEDLEGAVVGIDPGQSGALAFLQVDTGAVLRLMPMPGVCEYAEIMDAAHPTAVFVEKAQAMPKQGVTSMFTYGHHAGILEGVLVALAIRHELVMPRLWMKTMHLGIAAKLSAKERSLHAAKRWFPKTNLLATERSKKPHLGIIDALLIAEWGRRKLTRVIE